ncbi:MAG TPA: manganese catalase family protein [Firmicutes bacterium]|nr:manganese catalase family protein [Bacillota bacterium]
MDERVLLSNVKENRQFGFRTFPFSGLSAPANPHRTRLCASVRHCDPPVGTEELGHMEMVCAIIYQLTKDLSIDEIKKSGFDTYYVDHTTGLYPVAASGAPFTASYFQSKGDTLTDLHENLAAEQKARTTYDNILRLVDDPEVRDPIKFLRAREIVHYQRFGEALRIAQDNLNSKNFYAFNPSFDQRKKFK